MRTDDFDHGNVFDIFELFRSDDEILVAEIEGQFFGDRFTKERHSSPVAASVYDVELTRCDTATLPEGDITFTSRESKAQDPVPPLARLMLAAGYDPEGIVRITRNGTPVWTVDKPLHYWADLDIRELPDGKIVTRKYRPIPNAIASKGRN